ncbi:hypothetical protein CONCODRAFT_4114 [Conidiobolus coronatus NRRL 28638]|uniref:Uncharacterized protein n=1 Tax=Conidiobolus coronatus (strain ATCC 28846 / CBS 209.66 / NRRL 28638) TaxID=796925 RepID=A0A137PD87_CONC2|nr:hypothetical protein CONCODRAFT_4114 [Conidiobolus coronatus NRRL 28638]|eukprot:KXN72968.1 hypothetical protein CONCODRAFT_4114 [Conidiobolus coronatus NRRL 28638]
MEFTTAVQTISICGLATTVTLLLNNLTYWIILNLSYSDNLNIICQFVGLIAALIFQIDLLLINLEYFKDNPWAEVLLNNIPWQVYTNCYFIIFIRQSDLLLPKKSDLGCLGLPYPLSKEWIWLGNFADLISSISYLILELFINTWIIIKVSRKVRAQENPGYKNLVKKLCTVLVLYLFMELTIMICDISDNQMYGCIFWGINYSIKIQTETVCLGKVRECMIILETFENA